MSPNRADGRETRKATWTAEPLLHCRVSREHCDQHWGALREVPHALRSVARECVGDDGVAVIRMNLEIADIAGALYSAAQVTLALAEADAPDDLSLALRNCQSPARALEAIECEEIRSAVHAQLNGARHRARRRECDQRIIVRRLCVPNRERCARPHARERKRVARLQQSGGHLFHHAAG